MTIILGGIDGPVVHIKVDGVPTSSEIFDFMHATFPDISFTHVIWDFSEASLCQIDPEKFRRHFKMGEIYADKRGPGAKTAVLCNSKADFIRAQWFIRLSSNNTSISFAAFTNLDAAKAWLSA